MSCFRATATITFEFETEGDPTAEAVRLLAENLPADYTPKLRRVTKRPSPRSNGGRKVLGVFAPEDVLPYLCHKGTKRDYRVGDQTYAVKMDSHRYYVFRTSLECVSCGLRGTKFLLERHRDGDTPHFNLYAEEGGQLVLMTKDHIRAKSHGGGDELGNYQTMCCVCNNLKGNARLTVEGVAELRRIHNENLKLPRKALSGLIAEARKRLELPAAEPVEPRQDKGKADAISKSAGLVRITSDLNVCDAGRGRWVACPIHLTPGEVVACLKRGTVLAPRGHSGRQLHFRLNDRTVWVHQSLTEVCSSEKVA